MNNMCVDPHDNDDYHPDSTPITGLWNSVRAIIMPCQDVSQAPPILEQFEYTYMEQKKINQWKVFEKSKKNPLK